MRACGVVGAGEMGSRIARHLADAGRSVVIYDIDRRVYDQFDGTPVKGVHELADVTRHASDVIVTVGPRLVTRSLFGKDGGSSLLSGASNEHVFCLSCTVDPADAVAMGELIRSRGARIVDAPLAGGVHNLELGQAVAFVGGSSEDIETITATFDVFSKEIIRVGDVGAGQAAKLANNLLLWGSVALTVEAMEFGKAFGVAPDTMRTAMLAGSGRTWALETWTRPRPMPWCEEDMDIVLRCAHEEDVPVHLPKPLREAILGILAAKNAAGFEESSMADWMQNTLGPGVAAPGPSGGE